MMVMMAVNRANPGFTKVNMAKIIVKNVSQDTIVPQMEKVNVNHVRVVMKVILTTQPVRPILFVAREKKYLVSNAYHVMIILIRMKQITNIANVNNVRLYAKKVHMKR
jgi:hypothetical protein